MATQMKTRILNKISTWTEWESVKSTFKPLRGEICIVEIPTGTASTGLTPPAVGIKVGNGADFFGDLPWIQAVAGDVTAWCKENMADYDKFKAQVDLAVADSEGALQDALDALAQRVTNLEATVNTGDNSNAKLRAAISAVEGTVGGHTTELGQLTANKADKTQVATDIAAAKTAVLGQENGADYVGTVKGAYEAAATAKNAADQAAQAASTNLQTAKDYTDAAKTAVLGQKDGENFNGTVMGAYAAAEAAQGTANTNAGEITAIKEDIQEINDMLGGAGEQSVAARLTALETNDGVQDGKIKDNADAIAAEKERAEGVEGDHEARIATMENFWKAADDPVGTIDKLSEIVDYISRDEQGALDLAADIEANTKAIAAEVDRAGKAEAALQNSIDALRGDALETDTLGTVKDLAEEAKQAASDNLDTAKGYTDAEITKVLGTTEDGANYAGTVKGAYEAAADASAAAATADGKAVEAKNAADAAQDDADAANAAIETMLESNIAEGNGKISTIAYGEDGKLVATRKAITMADMSADEVFIFDCGNALRDA